MGQRIATGAQRFVGRARELDQLDAACAAAAEGRGSLAVVSGEAGIGKSRFCEEVADRARQRGLRVARARCWVDGGAPPLWPWQPILGELCGPDAADLLATDSGLATIDPDRFARFGAVTERLAAACAETPVCLIVDDVHAVDAGTLLLIRFVARSLPQLPLVLVLSRRDGEPARESPEAGLLEEIEGEAIPVVLRRFDRAETTSFLAAHGVDGLAPDVLGALFQVTRGNPLFLRRIAALGPPGRDHDLPTGLLVAIDQASSRLGPEVQRVVRLAAVLGPTPAVTEVAAVAECHPLEVLSALNDAAGAGLVTAHQRDRFAFSHDLVRSALEDGLDVADRLDAHARAVSVVGDDGRGGGHDGRPPSDRLARRAFHARAAAPRSAADAHVAVAACRDAAEAMVDNFAYEQADTLLSAAVALHETAGLGPPSGRLLVEWAQAALRCGLLSEARRRFDQAAAAAQRDDDPVVRAEAAIGLGGHWVNEHRAAVERARVLALQRSALAGLSGDQGDQVALRCRLRARLAAEAVFDGEPVGPVFEAVDAARRCGDPLALAETLSLSHHALFRADYTWSRLALADELIRVAAESGHGVLAAMGLCWRAVDLFHLGDPRALRALEELRERASALQNRNLLYYVAIMDVMLLMRAGRLDEAESATQRCYEMGNAVGEVDTLGYLTAHMVGIRWLQSRDGEVLEMAEEVAASPTLIRAEFSLRASAAVIVARAGRHKLARAALDRLARRGLADLPQSSTWLVGMVAIVETAAELGDAAIAREAYELLLPYAELPVVASLAVVCTGSTERSLGMAASTFGDHDRAVDHLERAVAANRRLGNLPVTALTQADLAAVLLRRDRPDDPARAVDLLQQAIASATHLGITSRAEGWDGQLADLEKEHGAGAAAAGSSARSDSSSSSPPGSSSSASGPGRRGVIYRQENRWVVGIDDRRVRVAHLVGLTYLAELLTRPDRPIAAAVLAGQGRVPDDPGPHELLDNQARAAYSDRARELTADLAEAEANNDIARAGRLQVELSTLVDQLEAATGLGNRPRAFANPSERARTAVRKAIKRAIDSIDDADPVIAIALRSTIETGHTCTYTPDPTTPVTWSPHPPPTPVVTTASAATA